VILAVLCHGCVVGPHLWAEGISLLRHRSDWCVRTPGQHCYCT